MATRRQPSIYQLVPVSQSHGASCLTHAHTRSHTHALTHTHTLLVRAHTHSLYTLVHSRTDAADLGTSNHLTVFAHLDTHIISIYVHTNTCMYTSWKFLLMELMFCFY